MLVYFYVFEVKEKISRLKFSNFYCGSIFFNVYTVYLMDVFGNIMGIKFLRGE